jgi:formamidopyrimidine-DNA glycosylase
MPELPEVETIRRDLSKKIIGKKITNVLVNRKNMIPGMTAKNFVDNLKGVSIKKIDRVGKLLIFNLKTKDSSTKLTASKFLLMHMKMTGQLIYCDNGSCTAGGHDFPKVDKLPNKYSHIIYYFADGSRLFFNDIRTFGYARIVNQKGLNEILQEFGIEPLRSKFTVDNLADIFKNRKTNVKNVLMNQKLIAGIGNIYADEILWDAKIKPTRIANKLTGQDIKNILIASNKIIKKAIEWRGTTFSNYVDGNGKKGNFTRLLKVYQKDGEQCPRCKNVKIKKIKVGQRGTHFCNKCQK